MAKAKKTLAKSSFVDKNIEVALDKLAVAATAVDAAVSVRAADAKKLAVSVQRLTKRKTMLSKRKKLAAARLKKAPSVEHRKALRIVTKDLATTIKEQVKAKAAKLANSTELALLKVGQRRVTGYRKGIGQVDRALADKTKK